MQVKLTASQLTKLRREAQQLRHTNRINAMVAEQQNITDRICKMKELERMRAVDSSMARASVRAERAITKQAELDRRSLHDIAINNPELRAILRQMR